ncbi:MAG TPA: electron transfer flavoprotein subunit alpha/FixB family protein [Jiangellaceae bacterium]|nr:electron transfer flavoprotein subunit alpha/FixB family protein [Jiangellaceae bacterium]
MLVTLLSCDGSSVPAGALGPVVLGGELADQLGAPLETVLVGGTEVTDDIRDTLSNYGVSRVHLVSDELLSDVNPEAWGVALAHLVSKLRPDGVVAAGSDLGTEVMARIAARTGLPLATNCTVVRAGDQAADPWRLTRLRGGGVLWEDAELEAETKLVTIASGAVSDDAPSGRERAAEVAVETFHPELDRSIVRTRIVEHTSAGTGLSLATAPVVVSGGRGVGSAEGFAVLEELAGLIGGAVGCSRVATNNGWRSHSDQVGQTGTKIAPKLYIASGISGATQHWAGCMGAKNILAINTDPEAPMVTKADYAVIGDVQEVLQGVVEEVQRRRSDREGVAVG